MNSLVTTYISITETIVKIYICRRFD